MTHSSPPTPPLPSGDPSPAAIIPPALLADLLSPALSLTETAARNNLSPADLSIYISRAAVSNQLASLHILAIERARLIASIHLPQAISSLTTVLKRSTADHDASVAAAAATPSAPAPESPSPQSAALALRDTAIRVRRLETLRRAATTIVHLTPLNPPVFNYSRAHAQMESQLKHPSPLPAPQPAPTVATPAVPQPPQPDLPPVLVPRERRPISETDLQELFSAPLPERSNRSRHARNHNPEALLATAGSPRPHEHWP